jgi:hypothetical protein
MSVVYTHRILSSCSVLPHQQSDIIGADGNGIIMFGGSTNAVRTYLNDVWVLDVNKFEWSKPNITVNGPSPGVLALCSSIHLHFLVLHPRLFESLLILLFYVQRSWSAIKCWSCLVFINLIVVGVLYQLPRLLKPYVFRLKWERNIL